MGNRTPSLILRIWIILLAASLLTPVQLFSCNCNCEQSTQLAVDKTTDDCCLGSGYQSTNNSEEYHCFGGQCAAGVSSHEDCGLMNGREMQAEALEHSQVWISSQKVMLEAVLVPASHISPSHSPFLLQVLTERPPNTEFLSLSSAGSPLRI
jgi:hypothetical protein